MNAYRELLEIGVLAATNPSRAATRLELLADHLKEVATSLRASAGMRSEGSMSDSCRLILVKPNGEESVHG